MHSRVFGTEAGIHFVPDNSQEFLPSFPSASFQPAFRSPAECAHTTLLWAHGGSGEAGHGPWPHLPMGLEAAVGAACTLFANVLP